MFCGGIGTWLYEDALGLRVAHVPRPAPPSAGAACASMPPLTNDCMKALASTPVQQAGLSARDQRVFCGVLSDARSTCAASGRGCSYAVLRSAIDRRMSSSATECDSVSTSAVPKQTLLTIVSAAPHADIVAGLRAASGWRRVGSGIARVEWEWLPPPSAEVCQNFADATVVDLLSLNATLPSGAGADSMLIIGVPLAHAAQLASSCRAATLQVRVSRDGGAAATFRVAVGDGGVPSLVSVPSSEEAPWLRSSPPALVSPAGVAAAAAGGEAASVSAAEDARSVLLLPASLAGRYAVFVTATH
jgi:hypothetical protein